MQIGIGLVYIVFYLFFLYNFYTESFFVSFFLVVKTKQTLYTILYKTITLVRVTSRKRASKMWIQSRLLNANWVTATGHHHNASSTLMFREASTKIEAKAQA